ncbi:alpha-D-ribose 1-methylphosphonate 5-triphosphate synthase subunit PhnG [Fulvimarina manganoxydans]|uniref:Alpha-D-ribose 1-methylphosphonate 5-triphosphate synthase subunit PhnG n=1 Tax=Fulvimarina manganoxydans TaxID=937218 RepID=A0A1W2D162_9HYPH|nr:phosphonate C-P lyase system protein PhnG [Fulvimarina manganoxydans]SMC91180.1 alpha-D-ribose 1-methylphosphonate 5-triphosphate synthase subunit PhnG [Fulvimarina manganoxydans]
MTVSAKHRSHEQQVDAQIEARRRAMAAFAQAGSTFLADAWERLGAGRTALPVRGPEVGLVMVRGRAGGGGAPFNLGEASVTRASVRLEDRDGAVVGHAMVLGRDPDKAGLAARFDALWQVGDQRERIETEVVAPIEEALAEGDRKRTEETEATRVDFFTMVRGED